MPDLLVSLLGNVLPDVIKRVLPAEKMSEAETAALTQQVTLELLKQDWSKIEAEYADRNSARQLAAQDIAGASGAGRFLASVTRPIWGIGAFVLVAWSVYKGVPVPAGAETIIEVVVAFYFGGRTIEKVSPVVMSGLRK